jgi:hypothetical protein
VIRSKCTEADRGHRETGVELSLRDEPGRDCCGLGR